jgi:hypothetical protein
MKTNNSADNGGAVCGLTGATCSSGNWGQAYANYLEQYAKDYSAAGIPLTRSALGFAQSPRSTARHR